MENPIKDIRVIKFIRCNPPKTGLATMMKKFLADDAWSLNFESLESGTSLTKETLREFNNLQRLELSFSDLSNLREDVLANHANL